MNAKADILELPVSVTASSDSDVSGTVLSEAKESSIRLAEEQTPIEPDPDRDEVERIEPVPTGPLTLINGLEVEVVPLKLRETMKLLKIVTRGAGGALESVMGGLDLEDPAAFAQTFGALIIFSIPEAGNEVVDFLQSMVVPLGLVHMDSKERVAALEALYSELANPELEDTISIIERVVRREAEDIRNLGKRIATAFQLINLPQDRKAAQS